MTRRMGGPTSVTAAVGHCEERCACDTFDTRAVKVPGWQGGVTGPHTFCSESFRGMTRHGMACQSDQSACYIPPFFLPTSPLYCASVSVSSSSPL